MRKRTETTWTQGDPNPAVHVQYDDLMVPVSFSTHIHILWGSSLMCCEGMQSERTRHTVDSLEIW